MVGISFNFQRECKADTAPQNWNSKNIHTLISRLAYKNIVGVDKTSPNKYKMLDL